MGERPGGPSGRSAALGICCGSCSACSSSWCSAPPPACSNRSSAGSTNGSGVRSARPSGGSCSSREGSRCSPSCRDRRTDARARLGTWRRAGTRRSSRKCRPSSTPGTRAGPPATATPYVSPQIEQILGFTAQEWTDDPALWIRRVHDEDRDRVLSSRSKTTGRGCPSRSGTRSSSRSARGRPRPRTRPGPASASRWWGCSPSCTAVARGSRIAREGVRRSASSYRATPPTIGRGTVTIGAPRRASQAEVAG
jgi:PAS fold